MDSPIKIVVSESGKYAVCSGGYGSAATATFIHEEGRRLQSEIQEARVLWIRTKRRSGEDLRLDVIAEQFPQIWTLCTVEDIFTYVRDGGPGDSRRRTPVQAANEIMQQLFPTVPLESIKRMGRKGR